MEVDNPQAEPSPIDRKLVDKGKSGKEPSRREKEATKPVATNQSGWKPRSQKNPVLQGEDQQAGYILCGLRRKVEDLIQDQLQPQLWRRLQRI